MEIKISVIIPVYNAERFLEECLDSIREQTLKEFEVIAVDDGSQDQSLCILERYARADSRLSVIHQQNLYAGAARNRGMQSAQGKYLLFLDADDTFEKDMFERLYDRAERTSAQITICGARVSENGNVHDFQNIRKEWMPQKEVFSYRDAGDGLFLFAGGWVWDKLFLREFIFGHHVTFSTTRIINDRKFVDVALAKAERISVIEDKLVNYRRGEQASLSHVRDECYWEIIDIEEELREELIHRGKFNELKRAYVNQTLSSYFYVFFELGEKAQSEFYKLLCKEFSKEDLYVKDSGYYIIPNGYERLMNYKAEAEYLPDRFNTHFLFPQESMPQGSRIVVYGAGNVGQQYMKMLECGRYYEPVLWIDKDFALKREKGLDVVSPDRMETAVFDYLLIAIADERISASVKDMMVKRGVDAEKILRINEE